MSGPATPKEKTPQPLSSRAALPLGGVAIPNCDREDRFTGIRCDRTGVISRPRPTLARSNLSLARGAILTSANDTRPRPLAAPGLSSPILRLPAASYQQKSPS